jgi:hypothetical protein
MNTLLTDIDRTIMIRNLLASAILLAASTSVLAGIAEDLSVEGATSEGVITAALTNCADAACKADVLAEAIDAGIDAASVMRIAIASGISPADIASALRAADVSESDIVAAASANNISPSDVTQATAGGNTQSQNQGQRRTNTVSLPTASVPAGISPTIATSDGFAGPENFDLPGFIVTPNNGIEFN